MQCKLDPVTQPMNSEIRLDSPIKSPETARQHKYEKQHDLASLTQTPLQKLWAQQNGKKQFSLSIPHDEAEAEAFLQGRNIKGRRANL